MDAANSLTQKSKRGQMKRFENRSRAKTRRNGVVPDAGNFGAAKQDVKPAYESRIFCVVIQLLH